mmetsp:Transcript_20140/g.61102  ORF Transcript_20140/g.61102 Transcript_20140/m.61102 type:complete len:283 (-) Transcript_20140:1738-2586(-)
MARNEEKAGNMLNKWITMKEEYERGPNLKRKKRPYLASECDSLKEAEYWRRQVIKDIAKGVGEIQNAALGEHVIRELNDKINKLIREKRHWNKRITALGGPDYNRSEPRVYEGDGQALPEGWGATGESGRSRYFYFGAAKTLPGVRELFEAAPTKGKPKRTRAELYKTITPDYYGYRDEDDGTILELEAAAEAKLVDEAMEEWERDPQRPKLAADDSDEEEIVTGVDGDVDSMVSAATSAAVKAHVPLPSLDDVRGAVLDVKKSSLLAKLGLGADASADSKS